VNGPEAEALGTPERRALINADTPFGVYITTGPVIVTREPDRDLDTDPVREEGSVDPHMDPGFGRLKIVFRPLLLEPLAEANMRDEIRMHGPRVDKLGELTPTRGCMRFCDEDLKNFAMRIRLAQTTDRKHGIILVGDREYLRSLGCSSALKSRWIDTRVFDRTGLSFEALGALLAILVGPCQ
jgi:hypothetical protein